MWSWYQYNLISLSQEERKKLIDAAKNGDFDLFERLASKAVDVNCARCNVSPKYYRAVKQ